MNKVIAMELDCGNVLQVKHNSSVPLMLKAMDTPEKVSKLIKKRIPEIASKYEVSIDKIADGDEVLVFSRIDGENWIWLKKIKRGIFVPM